MTGLAAYATSGTWTAGCMFDAPSYKAGEDGNPDIEAALALLTGAEEPQTLRESSMRWAGQYGLYRKLLIDEQMRHSDNDLSSFFNEKDAGNMGRLHRALKDFNALRVQGNNSLASTSAQEQLAAVNGLSTESRVEQRLFEVLGILYSNIADLKSISGGQEARLREIAQLCPIDEGFAVHIARSTLLKIDTLPRSYASECERVPEPADPHWKDAPVAEVKSDGFSVFPNPNNGAMTLTYTLREGERGTLNIFSVIGETVFQGELDRSQGAMNIDLGGLSSGIYLIRIDVNGIKRLSERMSILKE